MVHPFEDDEFTCVRGKLFEVILGVFEAEFGCGFTWFDLGEGGQAESEEGGANKEETFDHGLIFSSRIRKSRWGSGEEIEITSEIRMEERAESLFG